MNIKFDQNQSNSSTVMRYCLIISETVRLKEMYICYKLSFIFIYRLFSKHLD
jgi:hypothetical protein